MCTHTSTNSHNYNYKYNYTLSTRMIYLKGLSVLYFIYARIVVSVWLQRDLCAVCRVECQLVVVACGMTTAYEQWAGVTRFLTAALRLQPSRADELVETQRCNLVSSWSKLSAITTDDSAKVRESLISRDGNPFPPDVCESLSSSVLDIVSGGTSVAASVANDRKQQSCRLIYNYLPAHM